MPPAESEPAVPANERLQAQALDLAHHVIGSISYTATNFDVNLNGAR